MRRTDNSCGALIGSLHPVKGMQHKLLLLSATKKVIVAVIGLCSGFDNHTIASGYIGCGHYTMGGGGLQEGNS